MGFNLEEIEKSGAPISFLNKGSVDVLVGPCSAKSWTKNLIPLDGRHYKCSGTIILRCGIELHANFLINTHTFDFLERDSVTVFIPEKKTWYYLSDANFQNELNLIPNDIFPYKWLTDVPIDYSEKPPYKMSFYDE